MGPYEPSLTDQFRANLGYIFSGTTGPNPEADGQRRADDFLKRTAEAVRILSIGALGVTANIIPVSIGTAAVNSVRVASTARATTEPFVQDAASAAAKKVIRTTAVNSIPR